MPRYTVTWTQTFEAPDAVDAAAAAFRAACIDFEQHVSLVKVIEQSSGKALIVDWVTHKVCGEPQTEVSR
jgi:hypothetical protein